MKIHFVVMLSVILSALNKKTGCLARLVCVQVENPSNDDRQTPVHRVNLSKVDRITASPVYRLQPSGDGQTTGLVYRMNLSSAERLTTVPVYRVHQFHHQPFKLHRIRPEQPPGSVQLRTEDKNQEENQRPSTEKQLRRAKRSERARGRGVRSCYCKLRSSFPATINEEKIDFFCNCRRAEQPIVLFKAQHKDIDHYLPTGSIRTTSYRSRHRTGNRREPGRSKQVWYETLERQRRKKKRGRNRPTIPDDEFELPIRETSANDPIRELALNESYLNERMCSCDSQGCIGNCEQLSGCVCSDRDRCWGSSCRSPLSSVNSLSSKFDSSQFLASQLGSSKFDSPQISLSKFDFSKFDSSQLGSSKFDSSKFDSSKFDSSPFGTSQFSTQRPSDAHRSRSHSELIDLLSGKSRGRNRKFKNVNEAYGPSESILSRINLEQPAFYHPILSRYHRPHAMEPIHPVIFAQQPSQLTFKSLIGEMASASQPNNGRCTCRPNGRCYGSECHNLKGCICDELTCYGKYCNIFKSYFAEQLSSQMGNRPVEQQFDYRPAKSIRYRLNSQMSLDDKQPMTSDDLPPVRETFAKEHGREYDRGYRQYDGREHAGKEYGEYTEHSGREYGGREHGGREYDRDYGREYGHKEYGGREHGREYSKEYGHKEYSKDYGGRDHTKESSKTLKCERINDEASEVVIRPQQNRTQPTSSSNPPNTSIDDKLSAYEMKVVKLTPVSSSQYLEAKNVPILSSDQPQNRMDSNDTQVTQVEANRSISWVDPLSRSSELIQLS